MIASDKHLSAGKRTVEFELTYDGGKPGSGGNGIFHVNGETVAESRIESSTDSSSQPTRRLIWAWTGQLG
jgi:hypothetical protein